MIECCEKTTHCGKVEGYNTGFHLKWVGIFTIHVNEKLQHGGVSTRKSSYIQNEVQKRISMWLFAFWKVH